MSTPLSDQLRDAGAEFVLELDRRKFAVRAALWLYQPDQLEWRLVIATPNVRIVGPKKLYKTLQSTLAKSDSPLRLSSVVLLDTRDPLITLLSSAVKTDLGISGIQFSRNTINGHFIEDAYIYRMAA